jgi:hypothetical protein
LNAKMISCEKFIKKKMWLEQPKRATCLQEESDAGRGVHNLCDGNDAFTNQEDDESSDS